MKTRYTLIWVALFAALAGYVYFVEMNKPAQESPQQAKNVFNESILELKALEIKKGEKSVFLEKNEADVWFVDGIGGTEADGEELTTAFFGMVSLMSSRVITNPSADLAIYGLAQPSLEATMTLAGDKQQTLLVGDRTAEGSTYYAQRKGSSNVYLVSMMMVWALEDLVDNKPYLPTPTPESTTSAITETIAAGAGAAVTPAAPSTP